MNIEFITLLVIFLIAWISLLEFIRAIKKALNLLTETIKAIASNTKQ